MKKTLVLAIAALFAAVSCASSATPQEKLDAYNSACEALEQDLMAKSETMSEEEFEKFYSESVKDYVELGLDAIKKNPNDSIALVALGNIRSLLELDELEDALNTIGEEFQQNRMVKSLRDDINGKKATQEGMMFTDFTVQHVSSTDEAGEPVYTEVKLSDYVGKGKYMLVDFWSPWCSPCIKEIPNIKQVYEKYHGDKFDVLSVAVWEESRGMTWRNTIEKAAELGINWNQINNGHTEPAQLYGIEGIPHLILFGPDGKIVKRDLRGPAIEAAVAAALAE